MSPDKRIAMLREEIAQYDTAYYVYSTPLVTDVVYDKKFCELLELERANPALMSADSPTQRVGGAPVKGLATVVHAVPMLSIDNGFEMEVLDKFHARVTKALGHAPDYAADWKIDGCAASLIYQDGKLVRVVTRGDGHSGSDITHNAASIRGVPPVLRRVESSVIHPRDHNLDVTGVVEVRGEVYIPNSVFHQIVTCQEQAGIAPFKNSRSAASGAMQQLDPKECYRRALRFVAHGLGVFDPDYIDGLYSNTMWGLHMLGIPIIDLGSGRMSYDAVKKHIEMMISVLSAVDYPVDGIVLKLDSFADRLALGQSSSRHVSWALAYKWERYEAETTIVKLETQVGKHGTLTPVAFYAPVEIAETTVTKSTLFNFDEVRRMDPRVGDTVTLEKAGKIIPHLVRVHEDKRKGRPQKFGPPTTCPVCGASTERDGPRVFCTNTAGCPAQLERVLLAAGHRSRLDIDGLGPAAIQAMIGADVIEDLASLWVLKDAVDAKGAIAGMTPGKSKKLLAALEGAKTQPSWRLLASLNIKHCGRTNSELICKAVQERANWDNCDVFAILCGRDRAALKQLGGIGEKTAKSVTNWFSKRSNQGLLNRLRQAGLNMGLVDPKPEAAPAGPQPLAGKAIVATGKLVGYSRDSIKAAIVAAGGKAASSVSSKTDYLVVGADAGSKLAKAEKLGVTLLTEEEFNVLAGV